MNEWMNEWCFRSRLYTVRIIWAVDHLGKWDEFWYESCPRCRRYCLACWSAVQFATTVPRLPSVVLWCIAWFVTGFLCLSFWFWFIPFLCRITDLPWNIHDLHGTEQIWFISELIYCSLHKRKIWSVCISRLSIYPV